MTVQNALEEMKERAFAPAFQKYLFDTYKVLAQTDFSEEEKDYTAAEDYFTTTLEQSENEILLLHDERNGLERVLLHFSHFEKETQKLDERLYRITLRYDQDDETELLIRVLSFGPVLEVVAPITFRQLMRNRIQKQALYAARGFSQ